MTVVLVLSDRAATALQRRLRGEPTEDALVEQIAGEVTSQLSGAREPSSPAARVVAEAMAEAGAAALENPTNKEPL